MKNKKRSLLVLLLVVLVILLIRVITTKALAQVPILVSTKKIQSRQQITKEDIKEVKIPKKLVKDYFITNEKELIGQYVALNHTQYSGMPFHKKSVESIDSANDKAFLMLNDDEQVFSMKVGVIETFGNILAEGHRVDLYLNYNQSNETELLGENIRVVGVKDRYGKDIVKGENQAHLVLLAIREDFIDSILKAQSMGSISMTLTQGINEESLYHDIGELND